MPDETAATPYDRLRAARPELFGNAPGGIDILLDPAEVEAARRAAHGTPEAGTTEEGASPVDGAPPVDGASPVDAASPVGVVYADRFVTLVRDAVRFPGGALGLYIRMLSTAASPGAVVLPLTTTGDIVLVEHYRHATRSWHWEVPRGMGAPGATGAESAARELAEEIGAEATEWISLGRLHPDSGLLGDHVELFAARIDGFGPPETSEGIRRIVTRPWPEVSEMVAAGDITCGFTIAVLTRALLNGLLGNTTGTTGETTTEATGEKS
ncbi:NUDIX hydrolase [Streptosporangium nondiastaticum]|uniref:NUDIX hydrolase n=1 Tax=Streptosporangium nondiastaticum TaxID=35764 RepID=A0A9X7JTP9_9ACTN|nr:NUDIX hydrolase [Streptosporangium nondiastaticum]PSJ29642.1 NUDIX hydrolase [Streptosporangium nondiastaticum]